MAGQIHQIQPQYPRMIPKKRSFLGEYLPNMAQIFSQALLQQSLWQKRQKTGEEAQEKRDILKRQQHLEDLGYPEYKPKEEPMESWGPETKKVGGKYYGEPTPKVRDIPDVGKLFEYKGQGQLIQPKEGKAPSIKSIDVGNEIHVYKDGVLDKTYTKGETPGKGKDDLITLSKIDEKTGNILTRKARRSDKPNSIYQTSLNNGFKDYEITEKKQTKPEMTEREAIKEIGVVKEKIAKLKEMGPSGEIGTILKELRRQKLGDVAAQAEGKSVEEAIRIFEGYIDFLGKKYVTKETAEEFFPTEEGTVSGADTYINRALGR